MYSVSMCVVSQEESRMIRVQFEGSSRTEAVDLCRKAVERLKEYLPVGTQEQPGTSSSTHTTGMSNQQQQVRHMKDQKQQCVCVCEQIHTLYHQMFVDMLDNP